MAGSRVSDARGRPRDPALDQAILRATLELLKEVGYLDMTMSAVARQAGVGKPTVYLRWPHKAALASEAVASVMDASAFPNRGDLRRDLVSGVRRTLRGLSDSHAGTVLPALLADLRGDAELADAFREHYFGPRWTSLHEVLRRGMAEGTLPVDLDLELATDVLMGPIYFRLLVHGVAYPVTRAEVLVDASIAAWQSGACRRAPQRRRR